MYSLTDLLLASLAVWIVESGNYVLASLSNYVLASLSNYVLASLSNYVLATACVLRTVICAEIKHN